MMVDDRGTGKFHHDNEVRPGQRGWGYWGLDAGARCLGGLSARVTKVLYMLHMQRRAEQDDALRRRKLETERWRADLEGGGHWDCGSGRLLGVGGARAGTA